LLAIPPRKKTGKSLGNFCNQPVIQVLKSAVFTYTVYIKCTIFPPTCFWELAAIFREKTDSMCNLKLNETNLHTHTHKEDVTSISCML
jgi:hypothetical protein